MQRLFVNIEPNDPSGVVLSVEGLPRLLIFAETRTEALRRAREALLFQLAAEGGLGDPQLIELVPRDAHLGCQLAERRCESRDRNR